MRLDMHVERAEHNHRVAHVLYCALCIQVPGLQLVYLIYTGLCIDKQEKSMQKNKIHGLGLSNN